ncbi:MAG: hypothetical protein OXN16_03095 [Gammaproteobacteria bacterium]|nr:hypothetical protein [Gammaproteobacteria bacterium]
MIDFRTKYGTSKDLPWLDEDRIITNEAKMCMGVERLGESPLNDERIGRLLDMARSRSVLFCGSRPYDVLERLLWLAAANGITPCPNLVAFANEAISGNLTRPKRRTRPANWKRNYAIAWTASELVAWHGMSKDDALMLITEAMNWTPETDPYGKKRPARYALEHVEKGGGWQGE